SPIIHRGVVPHKQLANARPAEYDGAYVIRVAWPPPRRTVECGPMSRSGGDRVHTPSTTNEHIDTAREGVRNLVENVARVQGGQRVLILSEYGKVERDVADLIADAVKAAG